MNKFKIQSFWSDEYTFPEALDTGIIIEAIDIDDALKQAMQNIKPQVKPYIEKTILDYDSAYIEYFPTPSKNKTGYTEMIQITLQDKEDLEDLNDICMTANALILVYRTNRKFAYYTRLWKTLRQNKNPIVRGLRA